MLVVAVAAVVGVALAARGGSGAKSPAVTKPNASKQFGDDADLMRRLERHKLVKKAK